MIGIILSIIAVLAVVASPASRMCIRLLVSVAIFSMAFCLVAFLVVGVLDFYIGGDGTILTWILFIGETGIVMLIYAGLAKLVLHFRAIVVWITRRFLDWWEWIRGKS